MAKKTTKTSTKRDLAAEADGHYGPGNWVTCDDCPLNGGKTALHHPDAHSDRGCFRFPEGTPTFVA